MRLATIEQTTTNLQEDGRYFIEQNAKMYSILSSKLYTNPIRAIVREICTNAHDAHVLAGDPSRIFDITLPTAFLSTFEVRDYGPGLTHEQVRTVFTHYGKSTKDHSNDTNGALGLGSKSPFGYTSSYVVSSYLDETITTYMMYMMDGEPRFSQGETFPAPGEPNGLKISVPVKDGDHSRFVNEAKRVLPMLMVPPRVNGQDFLDWAGDQGVNLNHTSAFMGEYEIAVYESLAGEHLEDAIWMAGVVYPLNLELLRDSMVNNKKIGADRATQIYTLAIKQICPALRGENRRSTVLFKVPTGMVQFTPNREELTYDHETTVAIAEMFESISADMLSSVDTLLDSNVHLSPINQLLALRTHPILSTACSRWIHTTLQVINSHQATMLGKDRVERIRQIIARGEAEQLSRVGLVPNVSYPNWATSPNTDGQLVYVELAMLPTDCNFSVVHVAQPSYRSTGAPTLSHIQSADEVERFRRECADYKNHLPTPDELEEVRIGRRSGLKLQIYLKRLKDFIKELYGTDLDAVSVVEGVNFNRTIKTLNELTASAKSSPSPKALLKKLAKEYTNLENDLAKVTTGYLSLVNTTNNAYIPANTMFGMKLRYQVDQRPSSRLQVFEISGDREYSDVLKSRILKRASPSCDHLRVETYGKGSAQRFIDAIVTGVVGYTTDMCFITDVDAVYADMKTERNNNRKRLDLTSVDLRICGESRRQNVGIAKMRWDEISKYNYDPQFVFVTTTDVTGDGYTMVTELGGDQVIVEPSYSIAVARLFSNIGVNTLVRGTAAPTSTSTPSPSVIVCRPKEFGYLQRKGLEIPSFVDWEAGMRAAVVADPNFDLWRNALIESLFMSGYHPGQNSVPSDLSGDAERVMGLYNSRLLKPLKASTIKTHQDLAAKLEAYNDTVGAAKSAKYWVSGSPPNQKILQLVLDLFSITTADLPLSMELVKKYPLITKYDVGYHNVCSDAMVAHMLQYIEFVETL